MFLALIGFLMALVGVVAIFYAAFTFAFGRRSHARTTFRGGLFAVILGFVLFFVGATTDYKKGEQAPVAPAKQTTEQKAEKLAETPKAQPSGAEEPAVQPGTGKSEQRTEEGAPIGNQSKQQNEELRPPVIPGLKWVDITLNLERKPYGFRFKRHKNKYTPSFEREAKKRDPDTGAEMYVRVQSHDDNVVLYEVSVSGNGAKHTASWLMPYMSTAPFDGNQQTRSKQWALQAIEQVRQGKPVHRQVGDVLMELSGSPPYFYTLQVNHKDLEEYLLHALR